MGIKDVRDAGACDCCLQTIGEILFQNSESESSRRLLPISEVVSPLTLSGSLDNAQQQRL